MWLWILLGGVVLIGLPVAVGMFVPRDHVASIARVHPAAREQVWATITDYERMPQWRTGLRRIEVFDGHGGRRRVREHSKFGPLTYEIETEEPPHRLVGRIVAEGQGFGGTWTYEFAPVAGGTELRITERGFVTNPMFRFMARFLFGYEATMRRYQESLARRLAAGA